MNNVTTELNTIKDLVYHVLANNPDTRSNDTKLYVQCCKELGAKTLDDINRIGLSIISVHKIRQVVQNKENLYLPDENVTKVRKQRALEIKDYMLLQ